MDQFSDPNEPILYQSICKKRSTYNVAQQRILIVTGQRVYLFEDGKISRKHKIKHLAGIIKSTKDHSCVLVLPKHKNLHLEGIQKL